MKPKLFLTVLLLTLAILAVPGTALAQPPNDNFADAASITNLPYSQYVNMTDSTTEAGEPMGSCFYYSLNSTIWFRYTPSQPQSVTAQIDTYYAHPLAVYTGSSLSSLTELACRTSYWPTTITLKMDAGTTYYFQVGWDGSYPWSPDVTFQLYETPPPQANFYFYPSEPSAFDSVQFQDNSYDPAYLGFQSWAWNFGDGTTSNISYPTHRYAKDGDYTVKLTVTTTDGRTGSTSQIVHVKTHDVAIINLTVPTSASSGQTRSITVGVNSKRYPETVQVVLYKSDPNAYDGFALVGQLTMFVPVRSGNRTTNFAFSYTFTKADATIGKVTFKAVANIINARDALPADNTLIAPPTKVQGK